MRTVLFSVVTFVAVLAICLAALEIAVRQLNWLPADDAAAFDAATGLPQKALEEKLRGLRFANPDLVVIGDSYVETGDLEGGWVGLLEDTLGRDVFALGFSGAAPSQYAALYRKVRAAHASVPIVVVLYLGNDLVDEAVWRTTGPDKSTYLSNRRARLGDAEWDAFWPCYDASSGTGWLARRLDVYSEFVQVAYNRVRASLAGMDKWEAIARLQRSRCTNADYTTIADGHLFFVRHHEAVVGPEMQSSMTALLAEVLQPLAGDPDVVVAVLYDREQACRKLHGSDITSAAPVADSLRSVGLRVMEFGDVFAEACTREYPYLPDGHWNATGHLIFAKTLASRLDSTARFAVR